MTSQNLQAVPSPPSYLFVPDLLMQSSPFLHFFFSSCGHLLFKPFLLNSPSSVLCMGISNAALVLFSKQYLNIIKKDNQGGIYFSFHSAGQHPNSALLTGIVVSLSAHYAQDRVDFGLCGDVRSTLRGKTNAAAFVLHHMGQFPNLCSLHSTKMFAFILCHLNI